MVMINIMILMYDEFDSQGCARGLGAGAAEAPIAQRAEGLSGQTITHQISHQNKHS